MNGIHITIQKNIATTKFSGRLTAGTVGLPVSFSFPPSWAGLNIIAVFKCGSVVKDRSLIGTNKTTVPHEVMQQAGHLLEIGVEGRAADGAVVTPTTWAQIATVEQGANASDDPSLEPTPSVYDEIIAKMGDAGGRYELLETITVGAEGLGTITRDGFELDALTLIVDCPAAADGKLQPRIHYPTGAGGSNYWTLANITVANASQGRTTVMQLYKTFGWWNFDWLSHYKTYSTSVTTQPQYRLMEHDANIPCVHKLSLLTTSLPVGTTIKIYGVRRNEN